MELFARIRRDARVEGYSLRQLARRNQVGRAAVRMALAHAQPPPRKVPVRCSPKLDPFKNAIDAMLTAELTRHASSVTRPAESSPDLPTSMGRKSCRIRRCVITCGSGERRSTSKPDAASKYSSRKNTLPEPQRKSISVKCG